MRNHSLLLARYLIEPSDQSKISYQQSAMGRVQDVGNRLFQLIGQYSLYQKESTSINNPIFVQEGYMQKLVFEYFGREKQTLLNALQSEDYEEEGLLDLDQL